MKTWIISITASIILITAILIGSHVRNRNSGANSEQVITKPTPISPPRRIVSLAPNLTEILYALDLGDKVVAVSKDCDFPSEVKEKPEVGSFWQPDIESILSAKPDLIITLWFEQQKNVADSLERLGYKVVTLKLEKIKDLPVAIREIGYADQRPQKAKKLVEKLK